MYAEQSRFYKLRDFGAYDELSVPRSDDLDDARPFSKKKKKVTKKTTRCAGLASPL